MSRLTVVCWKWTPKADYRSTFGPETVTALYRMVQAHYPEPFRFVCVTDDTTGIDPAIETIPLWNDFADVPSPHGARQPSCYRRLRMFHPEIGAVLGRRFVSLDLDTVITADLRPLWNRDEEIVFWGDTNPLPGSHYNGSMILMTAGCRPQVWERFDPETSPAAARKAQCFGSDQGWISYVLGPGEAKWSTADGVYSFRNHLATGRTLPDNARVVFFHGRTDPWSEYAQMHYPWIQEHYPMDAKA